MSPHYFGHCGSTVCALCPPFACPLLEKSLRVDSSRAAEGMSCLQLNNWCLECDERSKGGNLRASKILLSVGL